MLATRRMGIGITALSAGALAVCMTPAASQADTEEQSRQSQAALVDADTPADATPQGVDAAGQQLIFSDEFNGSSLDTSKWVKGDAERQSHSGLRWWYKPENVGVGNGSLNLGISKLGEKQYGGSSISSEQGKFAYKYGTIEFRMDAPPTEGHLGAAWMMPENGLNEENNGTAADGAEYDLTETAHKDDVYPTTIHYDGYGAHHKSSGRDVQAPGLHSGYHTFSMSWSPSALEFRYDGKMVREIKDKKLISQVKQRPVMSNEILKMAEGDIEAAPKDPSSDAKFDYVRVWQGN